jgi:hypothetical protein
VLPAVETGHTAVVIGAKAKEIEEIDSEELDNEGAQARTGANRAGKMAKRPRTKRRASMPVKGGLKTVRVGAKANDGVGGDWGKFEGQSNTENLGGRADNKSSEGYDPNQYPSGTRAMSAMMPAPRSQWRQCPSVARVMAAMMLAPQ